MLVQQTDGFLQGTKLLPLSRRLKCIRDFRMMLPCTESMILPCLRQTV